MSEDVKNNQENMNEGEELDNILVLNDEDGNEVDFEFLDLIEYEGKYISKSTILELAELAGLKVVE